MYYVGKLDRGIYSCITSDIVTDEVIITDERIQHIIEKHPGDFERYCQYIYQMVSAPDYIIEANKPKSALLLKSFTSDSEQFKAILRLVTSTDDPEFKNSVITFMRINDAEWRRLIKNKKILYRHE